MRYGTTSRIDQTRITFFDLAADIHKFSADKRTPLQEVRMTKNKRFEELLLAAEKEKAVSSEHYSERTLSQ